MNQEIRQLILDGIKDGKLPEYLVKSVTEIGEEETFLVVKEIYLQGDEDIFKTLCSFDPIKDKSLKSRLFYLREIIRDLIPWAKHKHIYSVMLCLNFYLLSCDPCDITFSRILDKFPDLLKRSKEYLFAFVDILEKVTNQSFHFLLIQTIFVSLCKTDPEEAKSKIFNFLGRNNDNEQVGAITALPALIGFESEIFCVLKEKLIKTQSDWVISNIVMVLLELCKREKRYISEVAEICQSCLEKNQTLAKYFLYYLDSFSFDSQFEKVIIRAVELIDPKDEKTILHTFDSQLSHRVSTKFEFVLEVLDKLLVKFGIVSGHSFQTLADIREDNQLLAKTIFHWLSKSERKYWQLCTEISYVDDMGMDLSGLAPYIDSFKQTLTSSVLQNRIICGLFLVPKSALTLLFLLFKRIDDQLEASNFLDNLLYPFAICYPAICIQIFESKIGELNSTQEELVKKFLSKLRNFNEEIVNTKKELYTLRTTELENLILDEFEDSKYRDIYQTGMEQSIVKKLGMHQISILYGRGTFYYQRDADNNMKDKQISKLTSFTTSVTWPQMLIVCPAVLEELLFIKAIEAKE